MQGRKAGIVLKKYEKAVIWMALMLLLASVASAMDDFGELSRAVRENSLRLHIIANSDSDIDQDIKLKVRDALLDEYGEILGAGATVDDAVSLAGFLKDDITKTAERVVRECGAQYDAEVSIEEMYFDTTHYGDDVTMPAGRYMALRVTLGDAQGHNWWCVMYPPLCIPAASEGETTEAERMITELNDSPGYVAKFALVEFVQRFREDLRVAMS